MKFYLRWFMQNFQLPDAEVICNVMFEFAAQQNGMDVRFKGQELDDAAKAAGKETWDENTLIELLKQKLDGEVVIYTPPKEEEPNEREPEEGSQAGAAAGNV